MDFTLRIFVSGLIALAPQGTSYTAFLLADQKVETCPHHAYLVVVGDCTEGTQPCQRDPAKCPAEGCWRLEQVAVRFENPPSDQARIHREGGKEWCWFGKVRLPCWGWAADDVDWALQLQELGPTLEVSEIKKLAKSWISLPSGELSTAKLMSVPHEVSVRSVEVRKGASAIHEQALAEVMVLETRVQGSSVELQLVGNGNARHVSIAPRQGEKLVEMFIINEADYDECSGNGHGGVDHASAYGHLLTSGGELDLVVDCERRRDFGRVKRGQTPWSLDEFPSFEDWPEETDLDRLFEKIEDVLQGYCPGSGCRATLQENVCRARHAAIRACQHLEAQGTLKDSQPYVDQIASGLPIPLNIIESEIIEILKDFDLESICKSVVGGGNGGKPICPVAEVQ